MAASFATSGGAEKEILEEEELSRPPFTAPARLIN
jgi:hypothetical protein